MFFPAHLPGLASWLAFMGPGNNPFPLMVTLIKCQHLDTLNIANMRLRHMYKNSIFCFLNSITYIFAKVWFVLFLENSVFVQFFHIQQIYIRSHFSRTYYIPSLKVRQSRNVFCQADDSSKKRMNEFVFFFFFA